MFKLSLVRPMVWAAIAVFGLGLNIVWASEPLDPAEAFVFSATAVSPDRVAARWDIAPDHYMYRSRYQFEFEGAGLSLGEIVWPVAKVKQDEFFGKMETYEGSVAITLPISRIATEPTVVKLLARGQGCNEPIGICYPPVTRTVTLSLPSAAPSAGSPPDVLRSDVQPVESLDSLRSLLGGADAAQTFLHPDDAFQLTVGVDAAESLLAQFTVADGYYLYRDKIQFTSMTPAVTLLNNDLPIGVEKHDEYFGTSQVYYGDTAVSLALARTESAATPLTITASYQGCAEKGICYPPISKVFNLTLPIISGANSIDDGAGPQQPRTGIAGEGTFWPYILAAFGTGLLLTFTPCVLPMIPILSGIIARQGETLNKTRGGVVAGVYVLGTAITYSSAGAIAGATGDQLQAYFQNPWGIGIMSAILVLMAASMFGLFDIQMPSFIQTRLAQKSQRFGGGSLGMTLVLGMISALIVGACVSPLLISALGVAIAKGDPILGSAMMLSMALGTGVILVAVGIGAGIVLPKVGPWSNRVKQGLGVLLLGVAIYFLGTLPAVPVLFLWAALFIVCAVYLGATQAVPAGASNWRYLWKGIGTVMLVWGVLALIGGLTGNRDPLRPLPLDLGVDGTLLTGRGSDRTAEESSLFRRINSPKELETQLALAQSAGKPVILDYYADWCVECVRMERNTFRDPTVRREMTQGFVLLQVDVTDPMDPATRATKQRFGVYGPPAMLFFDADGKERLPLRLYGYRGPAEFLQILHNARTLSRAPSTIPVT